MREIFYTKLFAECGIYREDDGRSMLVVLSGQSRGQTLTFEEAVANEAVSFVFSATELKTTDEADTLLAKCQELLDSNSAKRGILWLGEGTELVCPVSEDFSKLAGVFHAVISGTAQNGIDIKIKANTRILCSEGSIAFLDRLNFSFGETRMSMTVEDISLQLCGEAAGRLAVTAAVSGKEFDNVFGCGFEYGFLNSEGESCLISSRLFDAGSLALQKLHLCFSFGFHVFSDNAILFLQSYQEVKILSNFSTLYGDRIFLTPVTDDVKGGGMFFLPRISENVSCAPVGKFQATIERDRDITLLCGFSGTEYLLIKNGAILEFERGQSAFSACYPGKAFSIEDFVNQPPEHRLSGEMVTAGVRFFGKYYSQPQEAPFFAGEGQLLSPVDLYRDFPDGSPMLPMMPYQAVKRHTQETGDGWAEEEQIFEYEKQILAGERSICIQNADRTAVAVCKGLAESAVTAATPSGFIGKIENQQFTQITVAFSQGGNLTFSNITDTVRSAFMDAAMFCVIANEEHLGDFYNEFAMGDWSFTLKPGAESSYNNYKNILIIKSARGRIYDPDNGTAGLCMNVGLWTCRDSFSKPEYGEASNLASWILNYCKKAYDSYCEGDKNYEAFARIITQEDWKGILALNVSMGAVGFPDCLKPLLAGMSDTSQVCVHHIGAELVPLKTTENGPCNDGYSPFFGLIYYAADGFNGTVLPITDTEAVYEFKLLELKVLFEKGFVKEFQTSAQLVLGELMGLIPSSGGCLYHALLLNGFLQDTGGHSALVMNTEGGVFCFQDAPVSEIKITGITMETINSKEQRYAFHLSGSISFCVPSEETKIDLLSYDTLPFTDYAIPFTEGIFDVDIGKLQFDLSHCAVREKSVCKCYSMVPVSMCMGETITKDFKTVAVEDFKICKALAGRAAGIVFSVRLGGLGALSGDACLTAKILLAWDSSNQVFLGLKLPGSSMIDGVLGITFGEARLLEKEGLPVLYISGVALDLFGLLKLPSNGALQLAMEGNGEGVGWFAAYAPQN